jgi:PadR family transcriptional regulator PadR
MRLLEALLEEPLAEHYGLDLMGRAQLASGTAYPILHRLEGDGWLESEQEAIDPSAAGRPRRRLYRLTALGEAQARALVNERCQRSRKNVTASPLSQPWEAPA